MEKILTVVVPTYNMEQYLERCLTSLIVDDEKMALLEVLVVNDGSKDRSSEIAHGYESRYPGTFRVIDKENGNYGSCINTALPISLGKYIKILDADDFVYTEGLISLLTFLMNNNADVVITNTIDVDGDGFERGRKNFPLDPEIRYAPNDFDDSLLNTLFMHELTYNMEVFKRFDYHQTEGISYTDLEWAFYPMAVAKSVLFCKSDVYCYRQGREGQTVACSQRCRNMWMEDKVIRQMYDRMDGLMSFAEPCSILFVKHRLALFSARQYFYYLLEYKSYLKEDFLVNLDNYIKANNNEIYQMMDATECHMVIGKFGYIHEWRRSQSRKTLKFFLYDTYRVVSNIRHTLIGK